jgi:origin recognition complex subunit 4
MNNNDFIQIRISGSVQSDDKIAVRSIAEQLDSEISRIYGVRLQDLERSEFLSRKSITLTMANILTLLDTAVSLGDGTMSYIEHPIVFIIDDVDVYAYQGRQTLLYNLFELVEDSRTPMSVLCFTSKLTIRDDLEKRVRSRFSQRTIQFEKFDKDEFTEVATKIIKVDDPQNDYELKYNENVDNLMSTSSSLRKLIVFNHLTTANLKEFQNHCIYAVAKLSIEQPFFKEEDFEKYTKSVARGSLRQIVNSLSDLETFLLVSAARVLNKNDNLNWCNLNIVYEEYRNQIRARTQATTSRTGGMDTVSTTNYKIWSKDSCKYPWETLQNIGLLTIPTNANGANKSKDLSNSSFEAKMWNVELTLDELRLVIDAEKPVKSWTRI